MKMSALIKLGSNLLSAEGAPCIFILAGLLYSEFVESLRQDDGNEYGEVNTVPRRRSRLRSRLKIISVTLTLFRPGF